MTNTISSSRIITDIITAAVKGATLSASQFRKWFFLPCRHHQRLIQNPSHAFHKTRQRPCPVQQGVASCTVHKAVTTHRSSHCVFPVGFTLSSYEAKESFHGAQTPGCVPYQGWDSPTSKCFILSFAGKKDWG